MNPPTKRTERRAIGPEASELRAVDGKAETRTVGGYAAVYNAGTVPRFEQVMGFEERIAPGAFAASVREGPVLALFEHRHDLLLGRTENRTLRLEDTPKGLRFELDLPDTQQGRDVYTQIRRGDIPGVSFGFDVLPDGAVWTREGDRLVRTVTAARLGEISPTAMPAYGETSVEARSALLAEGRRAVGLPDPGSQPPVPPAADGAAAGNGAGTEARARELDLAGLE